MSLCFLPIFTLVEDIVLLRILFGQTDDVFKGCYNVFIFMFLKWLTPP